MYFLARKTRDIWAVEQRFQKEEWRDDQNNDCEHLPKGTTSTSKLFQSECKQETNWPRTTNSTKNLFSNLSEKPHVFNN